jgi:hypothetical protein
VGKKKGRGRKVVLSLTGLAGVALVLNRLGILTAAFWSNLMNGSLGGMVSSIESAINVNFSGAGLGFTIALFIGYFVFSVVVRSAMKGKSVPLKGRISAVGA